MSATAGFFLASNALRVFGIMSRGRSASRAAAFNRANALENAGMIRSAGRLTQEQLTVRNTLALGSNRAAAAAGGVTQSGSVLDTLAFSATQLELDKLIADYNTRVAARSAEIQGQLYGMQGSAARRNAGLTALGQVANAGFQGYQAGLF